MDYLKICWNNNWNTTDSNGEKMLKIAICDDEKVFRDNINKYVAAYLNEKEISYEIDTF